MKSIETQICETLDKILPFIRNDGGDLQFVKFEDGIVYLRVLGACSHCAYRNDTIYNSVERLLVDEVPGVVKVAICD